MKIAFGTSVLRKQQKAGRLDGIGRYAEELLRALVATPQLTIREFVHEDLAQSPAPRTIAAGPFGTQALGTLLLKRPFARSERAFGDSVDIVHSPDHFIPCPQHIPVVATIHDAIPISHPEWINYSFKTLKNALWRRSAHWADYVITVSENSRREIVRCFGIPPERISVTPLGVGRRWFGEISREELERVRRMHNLPDRFFLFVGTLQPRKNVRRLIAAHRSLPAKLRREVPLVVAGRAGWLCEAEVAALEGGDNGALRYLHHVPKDDLMPLVQQAAVMVLPSLHEGFGLPVLEAFAAGTPVVTSDAGAIPEVAGDAAILVDPLDMSALAQAMSQVAGDTALADALRAKGRERAKQFTWQRTAKLTEDVYRKVLEQGKTG